ncbi:MAG: hypothetical protein ACLQNU_03950 [Candidatus Dormibacteria bacterium]
MAETVISKVPFSVVELLLALKVKVTENAPAGIVTLEGADIPVTVEPSVREVTMSTVNGEVWKIGSGVLALLCACTITEPEVPPDAIVCPSVRTKSDPVGTEADTLWIPASELAPASAAIAIDAAASMRVVGCSARRPSSVESTLVHRRPLRLPTADFIFCCMPLPYSPALTITTFPNRLVSSSPGGEPQCAYPRPSGL